VDGKMMTTQKYAEATVEGTWQFAYWKNI